MPAASGGHDGCGNPRLFARETTILVSNPYTQTETVMLKIRPIDFPPN
jgi:hypothetical protein